LFVTFTWANTASATFFTTQADVHAKQPGVVLDPGPPIIISPAIGPPLLEIEIIVATGREFSNTTGFGLGADVDVLTGNLITVMKDGVDFTPILSANNKQLVVIGAVRGEITNVVSGGIATMDEGRLLLTEIDFGTFDSLDISTWGFGSIIAEWEIKPKEAVATDNGFAISFSEGEVNEFSFNSTTPNQLQGRLLFREDSTDDQNANAIGDDFIGIHVALGAGAGLPHYKGKVVVEFSIDDFLSGFTNSATDVVRHIAQLVVGEAGRLFDNAKRAYQARGHFFPANFEVT